MVTRHDHRTNQKTARKVLKQFEEKRKKHPDPIMEVYVGGMRFSLPWAGTREDLINHLKQKYSL